MDNINAEKESYRQICHNMFIEGVIKQEPDGSFIPVDDPLERESIKSKSKQKQGPSMSQQEESKGNEFEFVDKVPTGEEDEMEDLS